MQTWGVERGKNDDHDEFWIAMTDYIRKVDRGEYQDQPVNCPQKLPDESPEDAILEVMIQEFRHMVKENCGLVEVIDRLEGIHDDLPFWPPFFFDQYTRSYVPKKDFARVHLEKLDPFKRFHFARRPALTVLGPA
jgi:hypothetical protein